MSAPADKPIAPAPSLQPPSLPPPPFAPPSLPPPPFALRNPSRPPLALPRRLRTPADLAVARARPETPPGPDPDADRFYRHLQEALADRERAIADAETRLLERTRDLDEIDALLRAREALLASTRLRETSGQNVSPREAQAVMELKAELDRREASLREARDAIREREKFLDESEQRLFDKVQQQQEKESELEQREENLRARQDQAAKSSAPQIRDEFRE